MNQRKDDVTNRINTCRGLGSSRTYEGGITLIALIITIIVLLILAGVGINYVLKGPIEEAKMAKFATEYREIEERVQMYIASHIMQKQRETIGATKKIASKSLEKVPIYLASSEKARTNTTNITRLPVSTKVTDEEKEEIKQNNSTLQQTIEEITERTIEEVEIYWIDNELIATKQKAKYIIDINTQKIYRYDGVKVKNRVWHTLEKSVGVGNTEDKEKEEKEEEVIWDGWIKLKLYYPAGATEKKWRLGEEGETRYDANLMWQNYTGPITVRLNEVENVWIKYKISGEEVTIPPAGKVLVDIEPDSYLPKLVDKVKVKITYDKKATVKEYKVGNSDWQTYEGEFYVTENTIVEARAKVEETISDSEGNVISTRETWGRDNIYVGNIGIEESQLLAPIITKKQAETESEVAKVEITYPEEATRKIYKMNYGEEIGYENAINITRYGTYVIAYYYNAEGKRSKSAYIYIGENNTQTGTYTPNKPGNPNTGESSSGSSDNYGTSPTVPSYEISAPTITVSPTDITTNVTVRVNAAAAEKIYIKIGNGNYEEYIVPVTVNQNTTVKAYYVTTNGENSRVATKRINNIKGETGPYVKITANPDPIVQTRGAEKVTVTIESDAETLEYSTNGIEYQTYTKAIEITENCRIYGRAITEKGTTVEYIDITNIGGIKNTPKPKEKLSVSIDVTPEPELSNEQVEKVTVVIRYDERATKKYYKINNGELIEYTGPIEIAQNCTIYGYALSNNGEGENEKVIDNLVNGISAPQIIASPKNNTKVAKTKITIKYDRNATITRYKIDNGSYTDYTGEIEIRKNCTITAYNKNNRGEEATSTYKVTNIINETPTIIIDKGKYYIIKLNYPENSTGREYKWDDGEWKTYKEDGILLIKPEYKNEIVNSTGNIIIKIEDETGKEKEFTGDYYFVTKSVQELMENIEIRWERLTPGKPTIVQNTTEPSREVKINIVYADTLLVRQYRIVEPDGTIGEWQEYTGEITIKNKNTIIYAKGQDEAEVWSEMAMHKVTNIDEEPPEIKLTADLETAMQKVGIRVQVLDDVRVDTVKWSEGIRSESYFKNAGNVIQNNSVITVEENGYYTIYAEDGVGNASTATLQVENIDKNAPNIEITIAPENVGIETTISIDYGDSTVKQYKIGESNTTWSNYTGEINLTSKTVITNGWGNTDNTVTVCAKGKDSAGNEKIVQKKILTLDIDAPKAPEINSNYGYPIITEYGIKFDGETSITYDTRKDITNLYSIDDGKTWQEYRGTFEIQGTGTIIAKSVKASGLETMVSRTIIMPSDAIGPTAYDGNKSTYQTITKGTSKKMKVDSSLWEQSISLTLYSANAGGGFVNKVELLNSSGVVIWSYNVASAYTWNNKPIDIPEETEYIRFTANSYDNRFYFQIKEIGPYSTPNIKTEINYPILTEYGVEPGHVNATIEYFPTSIQKLYKIDDGEWKEYKGTIRLEIGQTIDVKGIDKYGNETDIVSSKAALPSDALESAAYDGNKSTYQTITKGTSKKMKVDSSLWEQSISLTLYSANAGGGFVNKVELLNSSGVVIWSYNVASAYTWNNKPIDIPEETEYIRFTANSYDNRFYFQIKEIEPYSTPDIKTETNYPILTEYGVKSGHVNATIEYFPTSIQKLYKIDDGEWKEYKGTIRLEIGQTVYAKGIDKYGTETDIVSVVALLSDAIESAAYDGDTTTGVSYTIGTNKLIYVSSNMIGKNFKIKAFKQKLIGLQLIYYNSNGEVVDYSELYNYYSDNVSLDKEYTIPEGTSYFKFYIHQVYDNSLKGNTFTIYEIGPSTN